MVLSAVLALSPLTALGTAETPPSFPNPQGYVSDHAGVLDEEWKARIRSVCRDLEKKTGVEMVVVTTRTIAPYSRVKDYAEELYRRWGIGTAQQEHGVMVLASVENGHASVTLGRNMIRVISPAVLKDVNQKYIQPTFRRGQFGKGVYQTVVTLASASQDIRVGSPIRQHSRAVAYVLTVVILVGIFAFLWWITRPDKRRPFPRLQRGEFWSTGQGGFGGNLGGFRGEMSGERWK